MEQMRKTLETGNEAHVAKISKKGSGQHKKDVEDWCKEAFRKRRDWRRILLEKKNENIPTTLLFER